MKKLKFGIIGVGVMGPSHLKSMKDCKFAEPAAVCDIDKARADLIGGENGLPVFYDAEDLYASQSVDAVLIVTPHYAHTPLAIRAFENGLHVMSDKPAAAHKRDAEKMLAAQKAAPGLKYGVMYQLRTMEIYQKVKQLISSGELGKLQRFSWAATHWLRTQKYYDNGTWRATWKGEGGGVLLNQCPHQLDLLQWFFGMPKMIKAFGACGKYHNIEVEDDVSAYMEFKNGLNGMFIASTGEFPGTDRIEIHGDRGRLVLEDGKLTFKRTEIPVSEFIKNSDGHFGVPACWNIDIPIKDNSLSATKVIDAFASEALGEGKMLVSGEEGINQVELTNAIIYSIVKGTEIKLPLDGVEYEKILLDLITESEKRPK
ncbi:MAG: Gfo/Idh/MocA family oxidoreductase [Victivallales bacterium]